VGNYAITNGSLATTGNYALTINTSGANESITQASLTVTASNDTKTYGTNDPTLAYTTSGVVNGTAASYDASGNLVNVSLNDTSTALTGNLGRQSGEGVGNYAITNGSLATNGNYQLTIDTAGANESITPTALAVTASNDTKTYGTSDPTLTYTTQGLINDTVQSRDANGTLVNVSLNDTASTALTGSLGRQSGENVGNYAITSGSLAANANYALSIDTNGASESITPAALTVTASNDTKTYGTNDPALAYAASGVVNGTVQSRDVSGNLINVSLNDTATALTGNLGRQAGENVGNYAISNGSLGLSSGGASQNYVLTIHTAGANESITPAALAVTALNDTKTYGTSDPTLAYITSGVVNGTVASYDTHGNLIQVSIDDTSTALNGSLGRQSGENVGSYNVTAGNLAADANYVMTVTTSGAQETITPAALTVTPYNGSKIYGSNDPALAYATSGLVNDVLQSRDASGNLVDVSLDDTAPSVLSGNLGRMSGEVVGSYAITPGNLMANGNYVLRFVDVGGILSILPAANGSATPGGPVWSYDPGGELTLVNLDNAASPDFSENTLADAVRLGLVTANCLPADGLDNATATAGSMQDRHSPANRPAGDQGSCAVVPTSNGGNSHWEIVSGGLHLPDAADRLAFVPQARVVAMVEKSTP